MAATKEGFSITFDKSRDAKAMARKLVMADKVIKNAVYDAVKIVTERLVEEAVKRVPVDKGRLEESFSIKLIKSINVNEIKGIVYVADNAPAAKYAEWMHEWEYELGKKSAAKQAGQTEWVGRKYLERALLANEDDFLYFIRKKLRQALARR